MITRKKIIQRAFDECMTEMFAKAQPSIDYKQLIKDYNEGKVKEGDVPIYDRHYLSFEEFKYIQQKYIDAYRLNNIWKENVDFIKNLFENGGLKDYYIERQGNSPGYRSSKKVPSLKKLIGKRLANKVMKAFDDMTSFYRFDREEEEFGIMTALGCSPTSNAQTVVDYWANLGIYINIDFRDPETLYYRDKYGDNWKEYWEEEYEKEYNVKFINEEDEC